MKFDKDEVFEGVIYQDGKLYRECGWTDQYGYVRIKYKGKTHLVHRLLWYKQFGEWPEGQIDHINGIRSDNRLENLRLATNGQNKANSVVNSNNKSTGVKGVYPAGKKFRVMCGGAYHGTHESLEIAKVIYAEASKDKWGDYAKPTI